MKQKKKKLPYKYRAGRLYNKILVIALLIALPVCAYITIQNISRIRNIDTGEGTTMETSVRTSAGSYTIGNNPTDVDHQYFEELASALETGDQQQIAVEVVRDFIAEYYTWTNKDGNYDIGGMQYIFTDVAGEFESYTRDHFYSQLHLFINYYGRENLMAVSEVTVDQVEPASYTLTLVEEVLNEETNEWEDVETVLDLSGYSVKAHWFYEDDCAFDTSELTDSAEFIVVDHNGRMEIVSISAGE